MIVKDQDAVKRLNSPMNLINQLRRDDKKNSVMSLFGIGRKEESQDKEVKITFNPFQSSASKAPQVPSIVTPVTTSLQPERLDNILDNHDSQIKLGLAHDNALKLLNNSIEALSTKLDDIKADKLPSVISAASKTVESIRRERSEQAKNGKDRDVHFHFYTPNQKKVSDYQVIDIG